MHTKDNCGLVAHPSSTVASLRESEYGKLCLAMYQSKVMTTQLFVDKISLVSPLTALLFGAHPATYYPPPTDRMESIGSGSADVETLRRHEHKLEKLGSDLGEMKEMLSALVQRQ